MPLIDKIQNFLKQKLEKNNLKPKAFAQESNIPYPTVNKLINAIRSNPEFKTILKIADYFNCTIDEVIGRSTSLSTKKIQLNYISLEEINFNLKTFLNNKLKNNNINPYKLSKEIGFSENPIIKFIDKNNQYKTLSSITIVALADYFKVPIDEMTGRVSPSTQKTQPSEETKAIPKARENSTVKSKK